MPNKIMNLPTATLPQFNRVVTQRTWGESGHTYMVDGYPCNKCAACRGGGKRYPVPTPEKCTGMSGVSGIAGTLKQGGGLYTAGRNSVVNAIFGDPKDPGDAGLYAHFLDRIFNSTHSQSSNRETLRQQAIDAPSRGSIARAYGTAVHGVIEEWLRFNQGNGPEPFFDGEYYQPAKQVVEWMDSHEWSVVDVEATIYHPLGGFAGTADCIAERGTRAVFDWKTGSGIYSESALQVAGYACGYEAITGEHVADGYVLRSNADGLEVKQVTNFDHAKATFMAIVDLNQNAVGASDFTDFP